MDIKKMILAFLFLATVISIGLILRYLDVPRVGIVGYLEDQLINK